MADGFLHAVKVGDLALVQEMLTSDPALVTTRDGHGVSALMWAAYHGHPAVLDALHDAHPGLDVFEAAIVGDADLLRKHLAADPAGATMVSPDGFTALGFAAYFGHPEAASVLLEAGADPNRLSSNPIGASPLHSALSGGYIEVAHLLVEHGADPNMGSLSGWTPLHYAADLGDVELAKWLLDKGAYPGPRNSAGVTAAEHGHEVGHHEVAQLLEAH